MRAAINPTPGDWLYFVTVKPGDTRFTADYAEHQRNVAEFTQNQKNQKNQKGQKSQQSPGQGQQSGLPAK